MELKNLKSQIDIPFYVLDVGERNIALGLVTLDGQCAVTGGVDSSDLRKKANSVGILWKRSAPL